MIHTSSIVTIDGIDYSAYCSAPDIDVTDSVVLDQGTATFYIELNGELPAPSVSQELIWEIDGQREFAGPIQQILEVDLGTALQYQITATTYEPWLNRHLVVNYYQEMTADTMVKDIIGQFTHGFTTNNVQPSYLIAPLYCNYTTVTDTIKNIANQIQWGWYVDYYKDIHFFPIEQFVCPLPNNTLYADGKTDTKNWSKLQITEDASQLKTRIYLMGFKARVSTPVTLTFTGDGNTTQWDLGYKPSYEKGDVSVTVGGTSLTVKRDLVDGSPGQNTTDTSSAYVNYSTHMIRLNYAPASGVKIVVTMYYQQDTILMREDPQAVAIAAQRDGDGSDGRYEFAQNDSTLTSSTIDAANAKGDQLLYQYAYPQLKIEFSSFTRGWRAGQYFYFNSNRHMGGRYNGQQMFIQQVEKKLVQATPGGPTVIQYDITAASTPYLT